jgi:hypothetical protein
MPAETHTGWEAGLTSTPLRDLHLTIANTPLEPILETFRGELAARGITRLHPHFYLSTEWGVPFGTVSIAIPFYLARTDLTRLHAEWAGFVEGASPADILRYLRHEMGHVVNYAYELYDRAEWALLFGPITRPYEEEYRPRAFHPDFVHHLPGWYAQKHPDEDWAETFAVWMTPAYDWRAAYADQPVALGKLEYCNRTLADVNARQPLVTAVEADEDVGDVAVSLEEFYREVAAQDQPPPGLDGALQTIFEAGAAGPRKPAADLIHGVERDLAVNVFRWTGYFPERTRRTLHYLAERAGELGLSYPADREQEYLLALATFVTALAMNYLHGEPGAS